MSHAAFSPDGRYVVTASNDKTARVFDVSTDERPAEEWMRLTQFFDGEMDRFAGHTPLSPERLDQDWKYLRVTYHQDFTVTLAQALAWHGREVEACIKEQNPAAALFHMLHAYDLNWAIRWSWPRP